MMALAFPLIFAAFLLVLALVVVLIDRRQHTRR
jgi:hypothetical protein